MSSDVEAEKLNNNKFNNSEDDDSDDDSDNIIGSDTSTDVKINSVRR
jgi:hypothetical protein